jgi:methyl-accepting chemotaxis protein
MADETKPAPEHEILPESLEAIGERLNVLAQEKQLKKEMYEADVAHWEIATQQNEKLQSELQREIKLIEQRAAQARHMGAEDKKAIKLKTAQIDLLGKTNKKHAQAAQAEKEHAQALRELNEDGEEFSNTLLGLSSGLGGFTKKLFGTKGGLKAFGKGLFRLLNPFKLLISFLTKVIEQSIAFTIGLDKARAGFVKATGASAQFEQNVVSLGEQMKGTGVRAEEAAQAYGALYEGMVDFTKGSDAQRLSLAKTTSLFQELGVSAQTQADIANEATKSLGYGFGQVEGVLRDVAGVADGLNEPFNKVMENFKSVSKKLAFYGTNVMGVFKKLSAQAKSTGLSVDQLLGVVEQFDTFEGAGKAVGKLNAIMGGPYLNSIDMLNASEEERVEILKRSMKQSGMNFKQMGKYEQKMVASSLGIGVDEARKLFGAETEQQKMERLKKSELEQRQYRSQDIMENLQNMMEEFAIHLMPELERLRKMMRWVGEKVDDLLTWFKGLTKGKKALVLGGALAGAFLIPKALKAGLFAAGRKMGGVASRLGLGKGGAGARVRGVSPGKGIAGRSTGGLRANLRAKVLRGMGPKWRGRLGLQTAKKFKKPGLVKRAFGALAKIPFRKGLTGAGKWITKFFSKLGLILAKIPFIGPLLGGVAKRLPLITAIWGVWEAFDQVIKFLKGGWQMIKGVFTGDMDLISEGWNNLWTGALGFFWDFADSITMGAMSWIVEKFKTKLGIKGDIWFELKEALKQIPGQIKEFFWDKGILKWGTKAKNWLTFWKEEEEGHLAGDGGSIHFRGKDMSPGQVQKILEEEGVEDFIYRGPGQIGPGTITPIDKKDEFIGMKAGGAINQALRAMVNMRSGRENAAAPADKKPVIINVHIGQKKIETIVLDSLDSTAGKKRLSPFMRA